MKSIGYLSFLFPVLAVLWKHSTLNSALKLWLDFFSAQPVPHSPLTWLGQTTGLRNCSWNTNNGLAGARMARLCEFSRICGVGAEHNAGRAFSLRSKRKRPVTGSRDWPDAPTRPGQASVVLWWHFRQHLCKLTHNLVRYHCHFNTNAWDLLVRVDCPSSLRNCAYARNSRQLYVKRGL